MTKIPAAPYDTGPPSFFAGRTSPPTAADMDALRDWIALATTMRQKTAVRQTISQSIPASTWTSIAMDSEDTDGPEGCHSTSTNTSRFTAQTPGWYLASGMVCFGTNGTGTRYARIALNGAALQGTRIGGFTPGGSFETNIPVAAKLVYMGIGGYVEIQGWQSITGGGALATAVSPIEIQSRLDVVLVGP